MITSKERRLAIDVYNISIKGLLTKWYASQKQRAQRRGHALPTYTKKELEDWLNQQKHFEPMYNAWLDSDCKRELKPSIDRLDNSKSYTLDNIQLVTTKENLNKAHIQRREGADKVSKRVAQYTSKGVLIAIYDSFALASRATNTCKVGISNVVANKQKTSGGFIWK